MKDRLRRVVWSELERGAERGREQLVERELDVRRDLFACEVTLAEAVRQVLGVSLTPDLFESFIVTHAFLDLQGERWGGEGAALQRTFQGKFRQQGPGAIRADLRTSIHPVPEGGSEDVVFERVPPPPAGVLETVVQALADLAGGLASRGDVATGRLYRGGEGGEIKLTFATTKEIAVGCCAGSGRATRDLRRHCSRVLASPIEGAADWRRPL
jgi:hypothetical protein